MDDSVVSTSMKSEEQRHEKQENTIKDEEFKEISEFFESHSFDKIEKWLLEHAPLEVLSKISSITSIGKCTPHRSSVTSELFQQWLTTSPSKVSNNNSEIENASFINYNHSSIEYHIQMSISKLNCA